MEVDTNNQFIPHWRGKAIKPGPTYIRRCCALSSVSAFSVVRPRPYSAIVQAGAGLPWQTTCAWLFCFVSYTSQDHWRLWLPKYSLSILFSGALFILQSRRYGSMLIRSAPAARHVQGAAVVHSSDARREWPRGQIINYWLYTGHSHLTQDDKTIMMGSSSFTPQWLQCTCKYLLLMMCTTVLFAPTSHNFFST